MKHTSICCEMRIRLGQPFSETLQRIVEEIGATKKFSTVFVELLEEPTNETVLKALHGIDLPEAVSRIRMDLITGGSRCSGALTVAIRNALR